MKHVEEALSPGVIKRAVDDRFSEVLREQNLMPSRQLHSDGGSASPGDSPHVEALAVEAPPDSPVGTQRGLQKMMTLSEFASLAAVEELQVVELSGAELEELMGEFSLGVLQRKRLLREVAAEVERLAGEGAEPQLGDVSMVSAETELPPASHSDETAGPLDVAKAPGEGARPPPDEEVESSPTVLHYERPDGKHSDAITIEDANALLASGVLTESTEIWTEGMQHWAALGDSRGRLPGLTPTAVESVFEALDTDGSGTIDMAEFRPGFVSLRQELTEARFDSLPDSRGSAARESAGQVKKLQKEAVGQTYARAAAAEVDTARPRTFEGEDEERPNDPAAPLRFASSLPTPGRSSPGRSSPLMSLEARLQSFNLSRTRTPTDEVAARHGTRAGGRETLGGLDGLRQQRKRADGEGERSGSPHRPKTAARRDRPLVRIPSGPAAARQNNKWVRMSSTARIKYDKERSRSNPWRGSADRASPLPSSPRADMPPGSAGASLPLRSGRCVTRNSKSAQQLMQNTWAGILSLSSG